MAIMNKPSTIAYREFIHNIQRDINESNLPAFVLIPVIQNALSQLMQLEEQQYKTDLEAYQKGETDDG